MSEQSSTNESAAAGRAVDGNRDSNFTHNSCTLTQTQSYPWWRVDLEGMYMMNTIILTNREDDESALNGAEIWIGESLKMNDGRTFRYTLWSITLASRNHFWSFNLSFFPLWHEGVQSSLTFCKDRHYTYHVNLWRGAMSPCCWQVTAKLWVSVKWKCIWWMTVSFFISKQLHTRKSRLEIPEHITKNIYRFHKHRKYLSIYSSGVLILLIL